MKEAAQEMGLKMATGVSRTVAFYSSAFKIEPLKKKREREKNPSSYCFYNFLQMIFLNTQMFVMRVTIYISWNISNV